MAENPTIPILTKNHAEMVLRVDRNQEELRELFKGLLAQTTEISARLAVVEQTAAKDKQKRAVTRATARKAEPAETPSAPPATKFPPSTPNWMKDQVVNNPEFRAEFLPEAEFERLSTTVESIVKKKGATPELTRDVKLRAAADHLWRTAMTAEEKAALKVRFERARADHAAQQRPPMLELDTADDA